MGRRDLSHWSCHIANYLPANLHVHCVLLASFDRINVFTDTEIMLVITFVPSLNAYVIALFACPGCSVCVSDIGESLQYIPL